AADLAGVAIDDALGDRQAEAAALPRAMRLPVAIEHVLDLLRGDARPGVAHRESHAFATSTHLRAHADLSAGGYVLDRVGHEVREHLQDALTIGADRREVVVDRE